MKFLVINYIIKIIIMNMLWLCALIVITSTNADLDPHTVDFDLMPDEITKWIMEQPYPRPLKR